MNDHVDILNLVNSIDETVVTTTHILSEPENCKNLLTYPDKKLKIISQNIRSINCNMSGFELLLTRMSIEPDIMVLSECWLNTNPTIPSLTNYTSYSTLNNHNQNDGVVCYIKNDLKTKCYEPAFREASCLVTVVNDNVALISIYRPYAFKNIEKFLKSLDILLTSLGQYDNVIIMGDINIDIVPENTADDATKYLNLLASHGLLPAYYAPTHSKTCLDHTVLKTKLTSTTLLIGNSVTDHDTTLLALDYKLTPNKVARTYTKIDYVQIHNDIKTANLNPVIETTDCNVAAECLVSTLTNIIDNNTTQIILPNRKTPIKAWITPGLIRCMRTRDKLHVKSKKNTSDTIIKLTYLRYRNFCNRLLKKLKRQYEKEQIEKAGKKDLKKMWQTINNITNYKVNKTTTTDLIPNEPFITPTEIVNEANEYYINVGKSLADKIKPINDINLNPSPSTPHSPVNSFVLMNADLTEIISTINSLKGSSSSSQDHITSIILKQNKQFLAGPLLHICNASFESGSFPNVLKKSVITPVYKNGDKTLIQNYRPISILPTISKVLEKLINNRLVEYLETYNLLSPNQYGFRRGTSTSDAVRNLSDHIVNALDKGKKCLSVFLDFQKAFDTVSVPLLLKKLEQLGVRGIPLCLFTDYLKNRQQCTRIDSFISDPLSTDYGVPQGSVLGPTLFLAYINDLCNSKLTNCQIFTFADDTALVFSERNWQNTFNTAQKGLNMVSAWLSNNLLSLNAAKTTYITFSISKRSQPSPLRYNLLCHSSDCLNSSLSNSCNCPPLEKRSNVKYLGILLDECLTFKPHIQLLTSRIRKLMAVFKKLRHLTTHRIIDIIYNSLCQSLLMYCIDAWGGINKTTLLPLEVAQRGVLKVSRSLPIRYPTTKLYSDTGILTVRQLYILRIILIQHRNITQNIMSVTSQKRRKDMVFHRPVFKTPFSTSFHCFLGTFLYNKINKILDIASLNSRQCKLTVSNFLQSLSYSETEDLLSITK